MVDSWDGILPLLDPLEEQNKETNPEPVVSHVITQEEKTDSIEDPTFSYDGYQIVRGEYFAHINEPSVVLSDYKITMNNACLKKAPNTTYVQLLVNPSSQKLVIRPSSEDEKDSFCWCTAKHKPRTITCKGFYAMLISKFGWNPDYRYQFLGKMIHSKGEYLFVFDLTGPEIYQRQVETDDSGKVKRKTKRTPIYQESWKNQFGVPVEEHQKAVQINIFDGYAVFGITDSKKTDHTDSSGKEGQDEQRNDS